MSIPMDPNLAAMAMMMAGIAPGQQLSQAQRRNVEIHQKIIEFNGADQYLMVTPNVGPSAIKVVTPEQAAQMVVDKQGRLATEDEIEEFKVANEQARHEVQKQLDRQDLAKSVQRILRD